MTPRQPGSPPSKSRLADERTDMAWNRSGLAIIGCGLLVMREFTLRGLPPAKVGVGAVILSLGLISYVLAGWHARRRLSDDRIESAATAGDLRPVAVGVATIGAAAFVLGLLFPA